MGAGGGFEGGGFEGGEFGDGATVVEAAGSLPQGFGGVVDGEDFVAAVGEPTRLVVDGGDVEVFISSVLEGEEDGVTVVVALDQDGGVVVVLSDLGKVPCKDIGFEFAVEDGDLLPGGGVEDDGGVGVGDGAAFGGVGGEEVGAVLFWAGVGGEAGEAEVVVQGDPVATAGGEPGGGEALAGLTG